MILTKNFFVDTTTGMDLIRIIHEVRLAVKEANTESGTVTVVVPNPGAAVAILDSGDPSLRPEEIKKALEPYLSNGLIRCFLPKSVVIPYEKGRLLIEPFQEVFLIDYDRSGKRREFRVQVSAETPPQGAGKKGPGGTPMA